ncbi:MAG: DMT family transporter [Candidatus Fimadaptatus sp.]|jgi:drug/metabolite transporter (DMT)-like permease
MSLKLRSSLMLLLAAFIWGTAFVAQSIGMEYIGPHTFGGIRFVIGGIVLLPLIALRTRRGQDVTQTVAQRTSPGHARRALITAGLCCGAALFCGATLQQVGLTGTDAGKAGFITALYIVLVPVLGLMVGRKVTKVVAISVIIGLTGLYLLCVGDSFSLATTDLYLLAGAVCFSAHILVIDHFSGSVDPVRLSSMQFFVAGILGLVCMAIFETPNWHDILSCAGPILYAGVLSSGVAYTLQVVGQQHTPPATASLLMSFESVFSVLAGAVVLGEVLTPREAIGCVIMFAAILLSQLGDLALAHLRARKARS